MNMKCEVIQDLLPLYCDHQASPESCQLIEEHLRECDACKKFYETILESGYFGEYRDGWLDAGGTGDWYAPV